MPTVKVVPRSLTDAYKRREGDFSPNLVGLQFTDGVSLFTFGNFQITTTLDRKLNKNFALGGQWSDYYSLDNLNLTPEQSNILLSNDLFVTLNFDINKIDRYVYFGSFYEFVRVSLEQIIQKWKGSLYVTPTLTNAVLNTILSFSYNSGTNTSSFLIPTSTIKNPYQLIIEDNISFDELLPSDIFNLSRDYQKYVIWNGGNNYNVLGYTGSTSTYPYLTLKVEGNPFPSLTASTFGQIAYHVKPNDTEVELFFAQLEDFEKILLNRLTVPIYTASFSVPQEADGFIVFNNKKVSWPVTDGYNLDIDTRDYGVYVEDLLEMANTFDQYKTDLVARKFVSGSIHEFDTGGEGDDTTGRKVNKLLRIYGREFDEVKKYIDGISFANVVTYDKLDNTSDELIKIIARNLGFDTLLTVGTDNFDLLEQIQPSYTTPFSGHSRSLSSKELDIELWRRLVINAWWLYKSKGTRKVLEFFFKLFNVQGCMVTLDEYIYLAKDKLNVDKVFQDLSKIYDAAGIPLDTLSLTDFPIDLNGFPRTLPETNDNFFQMNGFWYNGGNESTVGNNPHFGEYDFGKGYFNQFECFITDFNSLLTSTTTVTVHKNYFNNYNKGTFIFDQNGLPVPYYGTEYALTLNNGLVQNAVVSSAGLTYVGGTNSPTYGVPSGDTYSMKIKFTAGSDKVCNVKSLTQNCNFTLSYGEDGVIYIDGGKTPLTTRECCQTYWLPATQTTSTTRCPSIKELAVTSFDDPDTPCIIYDYTTRQPVSQRCCDKNTLGIDVFWDGKNCLDAECSKSIKGYTVSEPTIPTKQFIFNSTEIFARSREEVVGTNSYICYWCPPKNSLQLICSGEDYVGTMTEQQVTQSAINYGWDGSGDPKDFVMNLFDRFFKRYGCIIYDSNDQMISNQNCCKIRGGTWTHIEGDKDYCLYQNNTLGEVAQPAVACPASMPNELQVITDSNGNLVTQECCSAGNWTDGTITVNGTSTFQDYNGISYANRFGVKNYCTACPINLTITDEDDGLGGIITVVKDTVTNTTINQECCREYQFNWDTTYNKCLR